MARKRYTACVNGNAGENPASQKGNIQIQNNEAMAALSNRWQSSRSRLTAAMLANDPQLERATMQLVYDTEQVTQQVCGEPTGEDEALLRIAAAPDAVNQ
jgi:acyl-homoserine lactone acylase PvdQ